MVPDPPQKLSPRFATWPANQPFHRVFNADYAPAQFNPGTAFRDASGALVPVLYGAEREEAAFAETIFQQSMTGRGTVLRQRIRRVAFATLTASRDLRLIETTSEYPRTVAWAKALHAAASDADGLLWMSHQFNTSKVLMLFGDRVDSGDLAAIDVIRLAGRRGRTLVERAATRAGVTII